MYIYDLESHHGTFLNKMKIPSLHYISVPSESIVKFGESTRIYAIHGEIKEGLHNCMSEKNTFTEKINHEKNADVTNYVEIIKTFLIENDEQLKFKIVENVNGSNMRLEISADICGSQSNLIFEVKYAGNKISENLVCKKAYERLSELGIIYDKSGLETNWKVWKKQREEDTIIESDVYFDECLTKSYIKNEMETLSDLEKNPSLELLVSEKNSLVLEKEHLTNLTEEPSEYMDEYDIYFKNINTEMRSHRIIQIQNRLAVINNLIEDMQKTDLISHK